MPSANTSNRLSGGSRKAAMKLVTNQDMDASGHERAKTNVSYRFCLSDGKRRILNKQSNPQIGSSTIRKVLNFSGHASMNYDVFNGDADGICALHQLRLAFPEANHLITGVKRDLSLLQHVEAASGDEVTVLDLALSQNRDALLAMLDKWVSVRYFDHHVARDIPDHPHLTVMIDTSPDTCTSLLVNRYLSGKHLIWAVVGAFGDNLREAAHKAAEPLGLKPQQLAALRELGEYLNYNGYG